MKNTKPKPSTSKLALREPAKPLNTPEDRTLPADHPIRLLTEQAQEPESSQLNSSQPPEPPQPSYDSQPRRSQPESSQLHGSRVNLIAALPPVGGHMPIPHQITDHLLRQLSLSEQAVYVQLYRLSWGGYRTDYCFIANEKLAERSNMSVAQVKKVTGSLEAKGLIEKINRPHGQKTVQGVEYSVKPTKWQLERSQPQNSQLDSSQPASSHNKDKDQKIDQKDASQCPDCFGTGYYYPEGTEKGVKRCSHERLKGK